MQPFRNTLKFGMLDSVFNSLYRMCGKFAGIHFLLLFQGQLGININKLVIIFIMSGVVTVRGFFLKYLYKIVVNSY
jgi:hypothetical protein